jgi:hypothetical protein
LKLINWKDYVSQNISQDSVFLDILSFNFDYDLGNLEIRVNLTENIEKEKANLNICYDSDQFSTECNSLDVYLRGMNAPLTK